MNRTTTTPRFSAVPESPDVPASGHLVLEGLHKVFGERQRTVRAVNGVSLDVQPGEFVTLLGPSGCGKTTVLRMIAGFETPTAGTVTLDDQDLTRVEPNRRPLSMVFQSYALFPHLNVRDNVSYGLRLRHTPAADLAEAVDAMLALMNLRDYVDRAPHQLSGGQQQRVALARALVMRPKLLLFDEPLSNLDAKLRVQMRGEIRRLQKRLGITSVFVTHDQDEAMTLSDRIVVMNAGVIEQVGTPQEVYRRPTSVFVADFIGRASFLDADLVSSPSEGRAMTTVFPGQAIPCHPDVTATTPAVLMMRPESVQVTRAPEGADPDESGSGRVLRVTFHGESVECELETRAGNVSARIADPSVDDTPAVGDVVRVALSHPDRAWLLPRPSGALRLPSEEEEEVVSVSELGRVMTKEVAL